MTRSSRATVAPESMRTTTVSDARTVGSRKALDPERVQRDPWRPDDAARNAVYSFAEGVTVGSGRAL